jgi:ubiquinol-cytochrome c reductase cytochrome c subunit
MRAARRMVAWAKRWLTRPSRVPVAVRVLAAAALGAYALLTLVTPAASGNAPPQAVTDGTAHSAALGGAAPQSSNGPTKLPEPPGAGNPTAHFPTSAALRAEGKTLYDNGCSSCHGLALQGQGGVAPALTNVGPGPVDFYLTTGRMPLQNPTAEPERGKPAYSRHQIDALIAYISSKGGPPAPTADPLRGELALGQHDFTLHCAGCHQIVARGGLTVGAQVPDLEKASAQQIAEAVRMGPYLMPHFDATQIDQHDLDSIARYVLWTRHPSNFGGWGIYNIGPIPEGMVAWFMALLALVIVARLIGERTQ